MAKTKSTDEIKEFWAQRAKAHKTDSTATLGEVALRKLEIKALMRHLKSGMKVLDVGCGNGFSTVEFARKFESEFIGVDYSEEMIKYALENKKNNKGRLQGKVSFKVGNVLGLTFDDESFDYVITERCLQNLPEWELQKKAIAEILRVLRPGGTFLMLECSKTGLQQLQKLRRRFLKPAIENAEPWHNRFFHDAEVLFLTRQLPIDTVSIEHFCSTYIFCTRLISRKLGLITECLPNVGSLGYNKLYIIRKR